MKEIWKPFVGFETTHEISNLGHVKSIDKYDSMGRFHKGHILSPSTNGRGYFEIYLKVNGKSYPVYIHRAVAQAFIPNPLNLPQVNHKDENKGHNFASNLEWCTNSYNRHYGTGIARAVKSRNYGEIGEKSSIKLSKGKVFQYDLLGNFVKEWVSASSAAKSIKGSCGNILKCCRGLSKQSYGFIWKFS